VGGIVEGGCDVGPPSNKTLNTWAALIAVKEEDANAKTGPTQKQDKK
jgi:hypothetical protein